MPKYNNKKVIVNGIKFDSIIESFMYGLLKQHGYLHLLSMQESTEIQPSFRMGKESIRAITIKPDFIIRNHGKVIYIDTKGIITTDFSIKWKMLKYMNRLHSNRYYFLPNTKAKCEGVITSIKAILNVL